MKHYELIVTQGFDHVASSIFQDLKDVDLANARSVCKHWYLYISKQKGEDANPMTWGYGA